MSRPRNTVLAAAWFLAAALGCGETGPAAPPSAPKPKSLILISIDTLRADHLGAYGYDGPVSPALDRIAAEGTVFEDVTATSPWTLPSHASLLTGLYPSRHGVRTHRHGLKDVPTLAGAFQATGFSTGAIVNTLFLARGRGLLRGFEEQQHLQEDDSPVGAAPRITQLALDFLEAHEDPFFLFLHVYDVHSSYRSLPRYHQMFDPGPGIFDGTNAQMDEFHAGRLELDATEGRRASLLYAAGVRQLDDQLHRLFGALRLSGRLDRTLLVVTSDHGEAFLEHANLTHGAEHYQEELRVPLILRGPGVPAGRRVATPVSLVDVAPTLRALFDLPPAAESDGHDMQPLLHEDAASAWPVFAEAAPALSGDSRRTVRRGRFKLIADLESGRRELYDLEADPGEMRDVGTERPDVLAELEKLLETHQAGSRARDAAVPPTGGELERLRALGYVE